MKRFECRVMWVITLHLSAQTAGGSSRQRCGGGARAAAGAPAGRPSGRKAGADDGVVGAASATGALFKNKVDRQEESQSERQQAVVAGVNLSSPQCVR